MTRSGRWTQKCQALSWTDHGSSVSESQRGFILIAKMISMCSGRAKNVDRESLAPARGARARHLRAGRAPWALGQTSGGVEVPVWIRCVVRTAHAMKEVCSSPTCEAAARAAVGPPSKGMNFFMPGTDIGRSFRSCPALHAARQTEVLLHRGHVALTARHKHHQLDDLTKCVNTSPASPAVSPTFTAMRGARKS